MNATATSAIPTAAEPSSSRVRAMGTHRYGSSEVIEPLTVPMPTPASDEVAIDVRAAGVDRGVWHLMTGLPYLIRLAGYGVRTPKVPVLGLDVAGTVRAVGSDVTRFAPGDEVFGLCSGTGTGSFATVACAKEAKLAHKPSSLTFEEAAAVPVSGLTAIQAVRDQADVQPGQTVLVVGASGGVGSYAVQLAASRGATVTGVCRGDKADFVTTLGADRVIDRTVEDFADGQPAYDVIIDIGGNASLSRLRRALADHGTLVITGGEHGGRWVGGSDRGARAMALSPFVSQRLKMFISSENHHDLDDLGESIDAGTIRPAIDRTYPLPEARDAVERLLSGEVRGKVVISVEPDQAA